jgi:hypothetical protein
MVFSKQNINNRSPKRIFVLLVFALFILNHTDAQTEAEIPIIEDFETDATWIWQPWYQCTNPNSSLNKGSAHSGKFGLNCLDDCFNRTDLQIGSPGQVISCWVRFQRKTNAYLGFGGRNSVETERGYYLVLAPEKNSFDFRRSPDYTFPNLKSVTQTYKMNAWYRFELTFNTSTNVTGRLYASNGYTLLNTITLEVPDLLPGGIAFRGHFLHVDDLRAGSRTAQLFADTSFAPKLGEPLILKNIVFEVNKSNLLEQSFVELNKLVVYLKRNPNYKINIVGYTDNIGKEVDNKNLSEDRAKAVAEYLIKSGIDNARIKHLGLGSLKPIASNTTEAGRQKNRRVEIILLTN